MDIFEIAIIIVMVLAVVIVLVGYFKPETIFFLKDTARRSASKSLFLVCFVSMALFFGFLSEYGYLNGEEEVIAEPVIVEPIGRPLAYLEVKKEREVISDGSNRNRLHVAIVINEDQSNATQADFLATVKAAAIDYHAHSGLPVVGIWLIAQRASNAFGEPALARAIYIPDMKGYDGKRRIGPWDALKACKRGFTVNELEYLRNQADLREHFIKDNGELDEEALDVAISELMNIVPNTLRRSYNPLENP